MVSLFCSSKKAFKLIVVAAVLSILLMVIAVLFSYSFASASASSFPDIGLRLTQQLENTAITATRQLDVSQNSIFSNINPSVTQDNNGSSSTQYHQTHLTQILGQNQKTRITG